MSEGLGDIFQNDMEVFGALQNPAPEPSKAEPKKEKPKPPSAAQIRAAKEMAEAEEEKQLASKRISAIRKIKLYQQKFPERLEHVSIPRTFDKKTSREVLDKLEEVEYALKSASGTEWAITGFQMAMGGFQNLTNWWNPLKLKIAGPVADVNGTVAASKAEWQPIVEELAIKYEHLVAQGPERRLIVMMFMMVYKIHQANSMMTSAKPSPQADQPVDNETMALAEEFIQ